MTLSAAAATLQKDPVIQEDLRVETVTDDRSFLALEPVWTELADAAGLDHPFLEFAWVRTWWECFSVGSALHVLVVKAGTRPIGIAPLILTPIRMFGIKVRRLGFFYNAHVPCADFLIVERRAEVYRAIWTHLSEQRCWDVLQLCQLTEKCETLEEFAKCATRSKWRTGLWRSEASPYIPLQAAWSDYFDSLKAKHRANLRNRLKRLKQMGPVELEAISSTTDLAEGLEAGLRLEAAGWKGRVGTAIHCDATTSRFYSTLAARASAHGWIRLTFLRAHQRRIAFDYSLCYKGRVYLLKLGYDPEYARFSPSNILLCLILESAFVEGVKCYEFLGANAEWKMCWANHVRQRCWLFVFPDGFKGRLLYVIKFRLVPLLRRLNLQAIWRFMWGSGAQWFLRGVGKEA